MYCIYIISHTHLAPQKVESQIEFNMMEYGANNKGIDPVNFLS